MRRAAGGFVFAESDPKAMLQKDGQAFLGIVKNFPISAVDFKKSSRRFCFAESNSKPCSKKMVKLFGEL